MRNRAALGCVVCVVVMTAACGKQPSTPTSPTVSTPPPPVATPPPPPPPTPTPPAQSGPIYSTLNPAGTVTGSLDVVWSERVGATDRQVYDDFVIDAGATIRAISWQGMRWVRATTPRFYVAFMADGGNNRYPSLQSPSNQRPAALWSVTFRADQVAETLEVSRACDNSPMVQCGFYDYSVALEAPFVAAPGTRYWVMIQSEQAIGQESGFSWRKGTRDNSFSTGNLAGITFPWDMAFALRP